MGKDEGVVYGTYTASGIGLRGFSGVFLHTPEVLRAQNRGAGGKAPYRENSSFFRPSVGIEFRLTVFNNDTI